MSSPRRHQRVDRPSPARPVCPIGGRGLFFEIGFASVLVWKPPFAGYLPETPTTVTRLPLSWPALSLPDLPYRYDVSRAACTGNDITFIRTAVCSGIAFAARRAARVPLRNVRTGAVALRRTLRWRYRSRLPLRILPMAARADRTLACACTHTMLRNARWRRVNGRPIVLGKQRAEH